MVRSEAGRHGFTLVELLVTMAVIAVLVGLLLPALQAARESARRVQCAAHLQQVGLALHAFHAARRFCPPGAVSTSSSARAELTRKRLGIPSGATHSWAVFLLPFLEQQPVYDTYELQADWRAASNRAARETHLSIFRCPSVPGGARYDEFTAGSYGRVRAATSDYGVNHGVYKALGKRQLIDEESADRPEGMMCVDQLNTFEDVIDGLSQTMWICEDAARPDRYDTRRREGGDRVDGAGWADRENEFITHSTSADGHEYPGPCAINCSNNNEIYGFHPGGATCMFGDGAVRIVSAQIELRVIARLLTRAGREFVTPP